MRFFIALFLCIMLPSATVFAQQKDSHTFTIKVFGAQDVEAPTAPSSLTATSIATDQIDLAWLASHDNFVVSGYVIYRNGVALATTTQLNYSDNGLIASTTYSYFVKAFDPSFNYSSSSNIATTTTLSVPAPPPSNSNHQQSTATGVILNHLVITPGVSTSTFAIETKLPARFELRWGRTNSYELGYTVNDKYLMTYTTTLSDLEPGTTYEYELVGYTPQGNSTVLERGNFTTLHKGAVTIPSNVNHFTALPNGYDVDLSWQLPAKQTYQYVRIVRSYLGFPLSPNDGEVVYQGGAEHVTDSDILKQYSPVYYTAFVVDDFGNVSSGAVAKVYAGATGVAVPTPSVNPAPQATSSTPSSDGFTKGDGYSKEVRMPDMAEIFLIQNGNKNTFADQDLHLDAFLPFTLSIPKQAITEDLKSIIVTLTDPTDSRMTSSFLLRINKDKTAYEAVVAPLEREGISRMVIDIYDYHAKVVGSYQKTITFSGLYHTVSLPFFPDRILLFFAQDWIPFVGGVTIAGLFFVMWRRRRKAEDV